MTTSPESLSDTSDSGNHVVFSDNGLCQSLLQQAEQALLQYRYLSAELCALAAISARPDVHGAYHLLGRILEAQGRYCEAAECYRGELSDQINKRLGLMMPVRSRFTQPDCQRRLVHPAECNNFQRPYFPGGVPRPEFSRDTYHSKPTWVDSLHCGKLWHDTHNTLVLDNSYHEIQEHRVGNAQLIEKLISEKEPMHLGSRAILIGCRGHGNYYHWMTDVLPKVELLKQAGFGIETTDVFVLPNLRSRFQWESLERLGISRKQVYQTHQNTPWITAETLLVPYLCNTMALTMGCWLPHFLKSVFLPEKIGIFDASEKIFVARDPEKSVGRRIGNYEEVVEAFRKRGFSIVFPEDFTVAQQAVMFSSAQVIAAPHGAGLANILFCRPGTKVIEYFGDHIAPCYWAICNLLDLAYEAVDCRAISDSRLLSDTEEARTLVKRRQNGFEIPKSKITDIDLTG